MSQIEIASFLRSANDEAVPVADWRGDVADANYVEGSIQLAIDGRLVLERHVWDYVDQLLAYMLTMLDALRSADRAFTYFPDQPVELVFERVRPGQLLVSSRIRRSEEPTTARVDEAEFTEALLDAATHFFTEMPRIIPGRGYSHELKQIETLRARHPGRGGHPPQRT